MNALDTSQNAINPTINTNVKIGINMAYHSSLVKSAAAFNMEIAVLIDFAKQKINNNDNTAKPQNIHYIHFSVLSSSMYFISSKSLLFLNK